MQHDDLTKIKKQIKSYPWVDVPRFNEVKNVLETQTLSQTYFSRGSGEATALLDEVEHLHREWVSDLVDLSEFKHCYVTYGTTDSIHHWALSETRGWQYLSGDYEYANLVGLHGTSIKEKHDPNIPLFLSSPSAINGNISNADIDSWVSPPPVILDCTYVGSTAKKKINVPKTTEQVFFSFSKGFGLVGGRLGLVYTKDPHPTLHLLKQFENWNYSGPLTMKLLMEEFTVDYMWNKYKDTQSKICEMLNVTPSDCFYLATSKDKYWARRRRVESDDTARLCITPLFNDLI